MIPVADHRLTNPDKKRDLFAKTTGHRGQRERECTTTSLLRRREPNNWRAGLYPHQIEGLAFLLGRRRSILADDMGLGKTRQSVLSIVEAEPLGPYLVVCPASIKHNWEREILSFTCLPARR